MDRMNTRELGAMIAICKAIPGSAAARAEAAQAAAEAAQAAAETHNMGVTVSGTKLVFAEVTDNE